jgi:hypothetical protein
MTADMGQSRIRFVSGRLAVRKVMSAELFVVFEPFAAFKARRHF